MLLFMDGMSHYQTSDILRKWTNQNNGNCTWSVVPGEGRNGGCIKRVSTSNGTPGALNKGPTWTQTAPWTPTASGVCGFALKIDDLSKINNAYGFDGLTNFYDGIFSVWCGTQTMILVAASKDGSLTLVSGNFNFSSGNSLLAVSTNALTSGLWTYLEFKWVISPTTAGSFIIRANGIVVMNYTGKLFPNNGAFADPPVQWTSVDVMGRQSEPFPAPLLTQRMCDFYLCDLTGTRNNDFLGDITVTRIIPNGAGSSVGWTPTPAVPNWQNVNEIPPNDDTSINVAITPGLVDLYQFEDIPVNMNPIALQHCILTRQSSSGTATIKSVAKPGATPFESPAQEVANLVYGYSLFPYDNNPATSAQWTRGEVNGSEFGIDKVT